MNILWSLVILGGLVVVPVVGAGTLGLHTTFGIVVPYAALVIFVVGLLRRVIRWGRAPVPFRIPTTCGQQRSLPWIKSARLDNPSTALGAAGRVLLEVLAFRSLFRNTKARLTGDGRLVYGSDKTLWAAALAFHGAFLFTLVRHLRFFTDPVPAFVVWMQDLDGFFKVGVPVLYLTNLALLAALAFLLARRLSDPFLRFISLAADYLPLLLITTIAVTGVMLRYFTKTDLLVVKELALGLARFSPSVPAGISPLFFLHLFLVSALFAYLPYSKLSHFAGVFLSPTRNLANTNRMRRHVNPWDRPVDVHTYAQWEEEFHDKIVAAGLPLDTAEGSGHGK